MWRHSSALEVRIGTEGSGFATRLLLAGVAAIGLAAFSPCPISKSLDIRPAIAAENNQANPQADDQNSDAAAPDDQNSANAPADSNEVDPLSPGEAVVTRFSHTTEDADLNGKPIQVININGTSASIIDLRQPPEQPYGQHWINEPQRMFVTAGEVGQVFGVAIAQREGEPPEIFLSATAAFGLNRIATGPGTTDWMAGQWGPDAGPGTIYHISADTGYKAEIFTDVKLDGRENTGAALGNIAYDKVHDRLFVTDLETGMIHSLNAKTGEDLDSYDHGITGRAHFFDAWSGQQMSLDPVDFDPKSAARIDNCGKDFSKTPDCWNIADFRRRVWGINVRTDESGAVRLYYSVWGSDALGNPDWAKAGDDRRNAVWSVAIAKDGSFDTSSVRREFFMPAFWPGKPTFGDKAGNSNAVADITFPQCGPQDVMLVAERGGMRNLGLDKLEPFARPYESRVVRYELGQDNIWRVKGRYDVGFHDRSIQDGDPLLLANAAGGVDFNYGFDENGALDFTKPSQTVWMTGDGLCSPLGLCAGKDDGPNSDKSEVHGLQGTPFDAVVPIDAVAELNFDALYRSYMIDTDVNVDENGAPVAEELARNDATKIGDVAIYQTCQGAKPLPGVTEPDQNVVPPDEPPTDWPVHTLDRSHSKWSSSGHRVNWSWHERKGSWHFANRSWHWRAGSWHFADRSWHWREGSWHDANRSFHLTARSFHQRNRTWDSNHVRDRSFHVTGRTWDNNHVRDRSFHVKGRTWGGDNQPNHVRDRSFHVKGRTWDGGDNQPNHIIDKSFHVKGRTWGGNDNQPNHVTDRSFHNKGRTWGQDQTPQHSKRESNTGQNNAPKHLKNDSRGHNQTPAHSKTESRGAQETRPARSKRESRGAVDNANPVHSKQESRGRHNTQPSHSKSESRGTIDNAAPTHDKRESRGVQDTQPSHSRRESRGTNQTFQPQHQHPNQDTGDPLIRKHRKRESLQEGY